MKPSKSAAEAVLNLLLTIFSYQEWKIERHLTYSSEGLYGKADPNTRTIHLYPIHPKDKTTPEAVLIHELLHLCHIQIPTSTKAQYDEVETVIDETETTLYNGLSQSSKNILKQLVSGYHPLIWHMEDMRRERISGTKRNRRPKS